MLGVSRALSSRTIVVWSVGLGVAALVAVTLLWVFLSGDDPADSRRLDAVRTASSLVIGAGGAAALLLAARRQRYVELDLEQKEHDADERRATDLYGKAADQLGSDKAPVRLAGVYALERLGQDQPRHRQTVVNLLCAYLRMPHPSPENREEHLVRGTVQGVLESHLQPGPLFWPDMDLVLQGAELDYFWFRGCQVRKADFGQVTFNVIAAFRDTTFTARAYFTGARFAGAADLRQVTFLERGVFRDSRFDDDVEFGAEPAGGRTVDLSGATAAPTAEKRQWPAGWGDEPDPDAPDRLRVVRQHPDAQSGADHSTVTWSGS
ncbi:pentapeptide repeat-containing protein [Actinophytocola sp.]|uniref:pentapeptide repeat-containing protein n=1 Tax=Actinophytocola sp. TaxID=1872138 RepID=UPI002D69D180|nr:pentapeptide repeat-containing protein [Actinophytocola sp.]HYQ64930.1 pentapeptide repeat-containing protein [Actinophytocola sp.]